MKNIFFVFIIALFLACNQSDQSKSNSTTTATTTPAVADISENPDYQKGLELVAKSDCLTCHKADSKLVGPSYKEVANKYESTPENISKLAATIIKGGKGNWGEVPMTPHPTLSQEDAEAMVKYVLLLK